MQDKIVNDMLLLTRDLKEQSKLACNIIKKDTEVIIIQLFKHSLSHYKNIIPEKA